MTPQQAINVIEHGCIYRDKRGGEALVVAKSALEKQIPKKPINIRGAYFGKGKGGNCPNCKVGVNSIEYKYCRCCGQALDWSDSE